VEQVMRLILTGAFQINAGLSNVKKRHILRDAEISWDEVILSNPRSLSIDFGSCNQHYLCLTSQLSMIIVSPGKRVSDFLTKETDGVLTTKSIIFNRHQKTTPLVHGWKLFESYLKADEVSRDLVEWQRGLITTSNYLPLVFSVSMHLSSYIW